MKIAIGIWLALVALGQAAGLEFTEVLKEIDAKPDATTVTADFNFTNKGDKPVIIGKCEPTCSCMKAQISRGKLNYAPGESGVIRTTLDIGNLSGTVEKSLGLWMDGNVSEKPSMQLDVRIHIPILVGLSPKSVVWEVGSKPEPKTIQIRMSGEKPIRLLSMKVAPEESFSCELKTLEEGKSYDLVVTPMTLDAQLGGSIRLETDCAISRFRTQQVFAMVRKAAPANLATQP